MIELRANPGPTGRLLREMLAGKGLLTGPARGVVNYGHGGPTDLAQLNARAGTFNKLRELEMLREKDVRTVPFTQLASELTLPVMARRMHHTRGTDIRVFHHGWDLPNLGRDGYYTQIVPKRREFRVWAYRRTCIGVYEKMLTYPRKLGRKGRSKEVWNWRNGYAYEFRRAGEMPDALKRVGIAAVDALGLDFGAVDIILGNDERYYVLEVNTAPGVEGPRQALTSLVNHIAKWAAGGFKKRNGEESGESRTVGARTRR